MAKTEVEQPEQGVKDSPIVLHLEGKAAEVLASLSKELGKDESVVIGNALTLYRWVVEQQAKKNEIALVEGGKPVQFLGRF